MHRRVTAIGLLGLALAVAVLSGCSPSAAGDATAPIHTHVVCAAADTPGDPCPAEVRRAAFDSWIAAAIHRPLSTFTIWVAGNDRHAFRPALALCVPASWGAGVMRAKAAFIETARTRVARLDARAPERDFPDDCTPPPADAKGMQHLVVAATDMTTDPGFWSTVTAEPSPAPLHTAVLCDRSDSGLGMTCNERTLARAYTAWIRQGHGAAGSSFTVYLVGTSRDTVRRLFSLTVPDLSLGARVAYLSGAGRELRGVLPAHAPRNASAVAEAIDVAAAALRERRGRAALTVLSDMRQFTRGMWNFERTVPDGKAFTAWLQRMDLLPDLHRMPVLVCGLHNRRAPGAGPFDARLAAKVRAVWQAAFRRMGAVNVRLRVSCPTTDAELPGHRSHAS